jgi:putative hydrolase of the HAD superfamily
VRAGRWRIHSFALPGASTPAATRRNVAAVPGDCKGLLIDVGGVLTTDIFASFDAFCAREGLQVPSFRELYFQSPEVRPLLHRLELGELHHTDVQGPLAEMLGLPAEHADSVFPDLYREVEFVPEMTDAIVALRHSGVRTGVLSNSWWFPMYDKPFYERAFDVQVISGKVGLRKPQREMFERGLRALRVPAQRVLFVDDFEENLPPAQELGMSVFLHDPDRPSRTVAELERRFGVALAA